MFTGERRRYIDWTRGLAVLVMVEAHTVDAWTRLADRPTTFYRNLIILGGFAAPLFLWLAGLSTVLGTEKEARRTGDRRAAAIGMCRRGLLIFGLAFLFRVQAFVLSPGNSLASLLRVDILNIMGPSIVATGLVWVLFRRRASVVLAFAVLATAVAMTTPIVRTAAWVDHLPVWLGWYVRPDGNHTVFTAFPWSGFTFAGAAVGALLAGARDQRAERWLQCVLPATGTALVALGFYTASRPSIYEASAFWTTSPTYFAIRVGIVMLMLAAVYWFEVWTARWSVRVRPLERLGRSSLFVYWIHVELVYGYASWPLRRHLGVYQILVAYTLFLLLLYGAVVLRDHVVTTRRSRAGLQPSTGAASA